MQRVAVVGSGGAGKTTFTKACSKATALPVVHLDEHFWSPGWVESNPEEWRERQINLLTADRWIVDGNYGNTLDLRLSLADTIIWLDFSRYLCLVGAVRRTLFNYGRPTQAAGCPERFDREFLQWVWNFPQESRPKLVDAIARFGKGVKVYRFQSRRDAREFLRTLQTPQNGLSN